MEMIKKVLSNGFIVLFVIGALYFIFTRECRKTTCPPKGQVLVTQNVWDSIQKIANTPPTVRVDTVRLKGKIVYTPSTLPKPVVNPSDTSIKNYSDSIVNKEINFHIGFRLKGQLLSLNKYYTPISTEIVKTVTVYVPKIVDRPVPVPKNGWYVGVSIGGNDKAFLYGGFLDIISKTNTIYGLQYQRYGNLNFYSVKLGIPIRFK